jgi:hypothetical protein
MDLAGIDGSAWPVHDSFVRKRGKQRRLEGCCAAANPQDFVLTVDLPACVQRRLRHNG